MQKLTQLIQHRCLTQRLPKLTGRSDEGKAAGIAVERDGDLITTDKISGERDVVHLGRIGPVGDLKLIGLIGRPVEHLG